MNNSTFCSVYIPPPSCSAETLSPITVFTTPGPVINMLAFFLDMKMKSVIAGE